MTWFLIWLISAVGLGLAANWNEVWLITIIIEALSFLAIGLIGFLI